MLNHVERCLERGRSGVVLDGLGELSFCSETSFPLPTAMFPVMAVFFALLMMPVASMPLALGPPVPLCRVPVMAASTSTVTAAY